MANESLIVGNSNWAVKANNLLGYAVGETSGYYVPRELDFTRNSTSTYTDENGIIQTAAANIARVQDNALLLEPQRTNSFTQSESFADYYINRATATDLGTPSIFSSGSIARFTANNAAAYFGKIISSITSGSTYTVSGFFDLSEGIYAGITDGSNFRIFNLLTASVVGSGGGTLTISCKSTQVGSSNYYRVAFTFTATTTGTHFFVIGKNDGGVNTTNETVAAGYFQREDSASYATSYIKTTSASVTRLADSCSKTGISSLIGQTQGTIYLDVDFNSVLLGGIRSFFSLEGNVTSQFSGLNASTSNNGNNISYFGASYTLTQGRHKIACTYDQTANQAKLFVDGAQRGSTSTFSGFLTTIDKVSVLCRINPFSSYDTDRPLFGGANQFLIFPTALTNTQLAELTTL